MKKELIKAFGNIFHHYQTLHHKMQGLVFHYAPDRFSPSYELSTEDMPIDYARFKEYVGRRLLSLAAPSPGLILPAPVIEAHNDLKKFCNTAMTIDEAFDLEVNLKKLRTSYSENMKKFQAHLLSCRESRESEDSLIEAIEEAAFRISLGEKGLSPGSSPALSDDLGDLVATLAPPPKLAPHGK